MTINHLTDKIGPDEMVAICWLYATVKAAECKCELFRNTGSTTNCVRCNSMQYARQAWPCTVAVIEGEN
jgi:hypothetical protein